MLAGVGAQRSGTHSRTELVHASTECALMVNGFGDLSAQTVEGGLCRFDRCLCCIGPRLGLRDDLLLSRPQRVKELLQGRVAHDVRIRGQDGYERCWRLLGGRVVARHVTRDNDDRR